MAVEDLGTMQFLFALVTDARDPSASSVSGAEGQLLQPKSDQLKEKLKSDQLKEGSRRLGFTSRGPMSKAGASPENQDF